MSNNLVKKIWLIGAGAMALEYHKIIQDLGLEYHVVGRRKNSAKTFFDYTNIQPFIGGLEKFLKNKPEKPSHVIVATNVEVLKSSVTLLLKYGIKNILVEKPGGLNSVEIDNLAALANNKKANIFIGYNRRFYQSTLKAKKMINDDGGVTSFHFDFTEWSHQLVNLKKNPEVFKNWFLANSSHVSDLAFFLGGKPKSISTYVSNGISWHPSASVFSGAGISEFNALFSYKANWESAGRWSLDLNTKKQKLIFCPIEKLQAQQIGQTSSSFVKDIDYSLDEKYKPGLFLQTTNFINGFYENMMHISEMSFMANTYNRMANYRV